jgi:hypothetical protein
LWPAPMPPDFFELEGGQLGLVVRDATVKGMPAALVMATTCGMLRAVAQSSNSPGEVLRRVNEALSVRIPPMCLSLASTLSWIQRAEASVTPTLGMTCLTCGVVTMQNSSERGECPWA